MSPEQHAQVLVGKFIEGLHKNGNPNNVHEHAKECARIAIKGIIGELDQLRKPEYVTFILEYTDPDVAGDPGETMDGYEKMDYYRTVLAHIENL